jgi:hypothetical protein
MVANMPPIAGTAIATIIDQYPFKQKQNKKVLQIGRNI